MKAFVFPGQGSQFSGMGKDLFDNSSIAKDLFKKADEILGFEISKIMFEGSDEDLKQTKVTQPAVFLHSVISVMAKPELFTPDAVAGHSLGELSALTAAGALSFEDGLTLVSKRAMAMQKCCEYQQSGMAAVLGLDDEKVEQICAEISSDNNIVVAANYNCPGQIVISGALDALDKACQAMTEAGAKRAIKLAVSGAFHSPLMLPAQEELEKAIASVEFKNPICPVYQNVDATKHQDANEIKANLIKQLTSPVRWTKTIQNMVSAGVTEVIECGPGAVLQGLMRKIDRGVKASHFGEC